MADEQTTRQEPESNATALPLEPDRPVTLQVENPNGDVTVRIADRPDVLVRAVKHGRRDSVRYDEAAVETAVDGNHVHVRVVIPSVWRGTDFGRAIFKHLEGGRIKLNADAFAFTKTAPGDVRFDLTIELPRTILAHQSSRVAVRTASGDVRIEEVRGTIDVALASGDVRLRDIAGEITVHTASGDLTVERPDGRLTARTASGNIGVTGGCLTRFALTSVSGTLTVDSRLRGDAASHAESVSGDIRLTLGIPAAGGSLAFKSVSGEATVAPPFRSVGKRTWRLGPRESGGPSISVKTVSGDLDARADLLAGETAPRRAETAQPAPSEVVATPEQPAADPKDGARLAVLQALERGDIDIEEAMSRLDGIGHGA